MSEAGHKRRCKQCGHMEWWHIFVCSECGNALKRTVTPCYSERYYAALEAEVKAEDTALEGEDSQEELPWELLDDVVQDEGGCAN